MLLLDSLLSKWTKDADMMNLSRDIEEAKEAQDKAIDGVKSASRDGDTNKKQVHKVNLGRLHRFPCDLPPFAQW